MKQIRAIFLIIAIIFVLTGCGSEKAQGRIDGAYESYRELIEALECRDFDSAHGFIDAMAGVQVTTLPEGAEETQDAVIQSEPTVPETYGHDVVHIPLDRHNLLDYFEFREDYIFEDTVSCYQNLQLREEYRKDLVDICDARMELSGFDTVAYGMLDESDQLFFADRYEMVTGELAYRSVEISQNGEGFISLGEYDGRDRCFRDYLMDIAIVEASGTLILEGK